ncbi:UNVERIFIED_CONTAM: hypothetical protein PYX00_001666 [Menopon gallinae]|uniref:Uncharacterized protein n=1 Tax=Menopon gallinae TaxID=328185 RepID=A0AAW2IEW2_9NEOP
MCVPACCALHALWGTLYTAGGSIQMVAGVVFLLALPNFKFGSNIAAGIINVLLGVVTLMISCLGNLNCSRCHKLLAISIIILTVNVINLVFLEIGEWYYFLTDDMQQTISESTQMRELAKYARLSTSVTTAVMIVISFIDSQLTFCSMEYLKKPKYSRYTYNHETDIEYVIPRDKGNSSGSKNSSFHHCTQAWVFDAENGTPSETDSPYQKIPPSAPAANEVDSRADCRTASAGSSSSRLGESSEGHPRRETGYPKECPTGSGRSDRYASHYSSTSLRRPDRDRRLDPPTIKVQVNTAAEDGNEVDRQLNHMKTFYRTPSRGGLSHQSSFSSIPPIYECLERLTQPKVYMSRLDIYRTANEETSRPVSASSDYPKPPHSPDPGDNVHYAALVAELEKTLDKKKDSRPGSSALASASDSFAGEVANHGEGRRDERQRGSDAAFSKELEAALKLIQDLESPNTVDTPSDTCTLVEDTIVKRRKSCDEDDDDIGSSKTLSGNSSFDAQGKNNNTLPVESQSTSGFNSLSHERSNRITPIPGFSTDNVSESKDPGMACVIRHMGETAVISLFSPTKEPHPYLNGDPVGREFRTVTSEKIYINKVNLDNCEKRTSSMIELKSKSSEREEKTAKSRLAKLRHLIDRKRRPSLLPEVESAIIKSECLAFLSDNELKDRLNQTKNIHRQIEAKIHRQRSFRRADSFGSVEDMLDRFCTTTRL